MVGSMEFGLQQHVQTFCDNAIDVRFTFFGNFSRRSPN
jgi:hypothetical protein